MVTSFCPSVRARRRSSYGASTGSTPPRWRPRSRMHRSPPRRTRRLSRPLATVDINVCSNLESSTWSPSMSDSVCFYLFSDSIPSWPAAAPAAISSFGTSNNSFDGFRRPTCPFPPSPRTRIRAVPSVDQDERRDPTTPSASPMRVPVPALSRTRALHGEARLGPDRCTTSPILSK